MGRWRKVIVEADVDSRIDGGVMSTDDCGLRGLSTFCIMDLWFHFSYQ